MKDPTKLMKAVEAAFTLGGLKACEPLREPAATSRRIVDAVAGVMADGWTPVAIAIITATADTPILKQDSMLRGRKRRSPDASTMGAGGLVVTGRREETDAELRERMKMYHRNVSPPYGPLTRGWRTIWGSVEWGWCFPDGNVMTFEEGTRWFKSVVFQVLTENEARKSLTQVGRMGIGEAQHLGIV